MSGIIIPVRLIDGAQPLEIKDKGDWIDLHANEDVTVSGAHVQGRKVQFDTVMIPLGIAMRIPAGYEAIVAPRSSTFKTYGLVQWNSIGVIDNTYCGTNDQWMFVGICMKDGKVSKGDRICQFRIQLSQKASVWQKIKWLLTGGNIVFKYVDSLSETDRHGFGEGTGAR